VNVAPHPPSPLPRPLPPRTPSSTAVTFGSPLSSNPAPCPLCLSGKSLPDLHESPVTNHKSRLFMHLPALELSCLSFSHPRPLFSIVCGLFYENTRGGIPLPDLRRSHLTTRSSRPSCAKAQKCPPVSPLPAALTDSLSRKSFPCHSYANTRGVCVAPPKFFASGLQPSTVDCKLRFPLTTFRINTCISVASKRLYLPLESTLMKKQGEGGGGC
jgi:hypothetical protein